MAVDYKQLYEIAIHVGEVQAQRAIQYANTARVLRGVIWKATIHLRCGRADRAREVLEKQIEQLKKDQQL